MSAVEAYCDMIVRDIRASILIYLRDNGPATMSYMHGMFNSSGNHTPMALLDRALTELVSNSLIRVTPGCRAARGAADCKWEAV